MSTCREENLLACRLWLAGPFHCIPRHIHAWEVLFVFFGTLLLPFWEKFCTDLLPGLAKQAFHPKRAFFLQMYLLEVT